MDVDATMSRTVIFVGPEERLIQAHDLMMLYDFRHLPVVEDGKLLGMLSDRDVLRWSSQIDGKQVVPDMLVCDAMCSQIVTCSLRSCVANVARLMIELQIDAVPVMDQHNELAGLVTSTDLLALLANSDDDLSKKLLPFTFELNSAESLAA